MTSELKTWHSAAYASQWAAEDVIADMLALPRRLSVALVADAQIEVGHVVDLGAGPGAYLEPFLRAFPGARGTWIDSSEPMREAAEEQLAPFADRVTYVVADVERLADLDLERADVVVTSRVLHHFAPESIGRVFREAHELLVPGGFFFDLDHVGVPGDWRERYKRIRDELTGTRTHKLKPHRHDYPLRSVVDLLGDAEAAGFETPDVPWRTLYTTLIVGRRA